jgi:hypothetical protein
MGAGQSGQARTEDCDSHGSPLPHTVGFASAGVAMRAKTQQAPPARRLLCSHGVWG